MQHLSEKPRYVNQSLIHACNYYTSSCRSQFQIDYMSSVKIFITEKKLLFTFVQMNFKT